MVQFNRKQLLSAVQFGQVRTSNSVKRRDNWGLRNNDAVEDARRQTVGTLGEWAVANSFGKEYICTVNTFKAPDVVINGVGIQVKASEKAEFLIIRPDAKDDEPYVLVHVIMPKGDPRQWAQYDRMNAWAYIRGWMYPWQARLMAEQDANLWRDPAHRNSPAIFIPKAELFPLDTLREIVYTK